jgi:hypothetical protein
VAPSTSFPTAAAPATISFTVNQVILLICVIKFCS